MIIDYEFNTMGQYRPLALLDAAIVAEENGFSAAWAGNSNMRDPTILLTAIAGRTTKMNVGTSDGHPTHRARLVKACRKRLQGMR